ncbi:nuclear transport factor 2 family protein [Streptomyces olivaceiscleroticus]|uniref:SnoaL-like domain-containing protein n=1 Tax=Streptomyces olivaceiscleroticus TaxID=68245 RepID=A0ABN0ZLR5_9ACTN
MTERTDPVDVADLPEVVTHYLRAHEAKDVAAAEATFAPEATVTDEGRTYRGPVAIRGWLEQTGTQYTYTTALIGAERHGPDRYTAVQHLEGDFPGGQVDLCYRFVLDEQRRISRLDIAP